MALGTGETYVACALAQRACRKGFRALYRRAPDRLFITGVRTDSRRAAVALADRMGAVERRLGARRC